MEFNSSLNFEDLFGPDLVPSEELSVDSPGSGVSVDSGHGSLSSYDGSSSSSPVYLPSLDTRAQSDWDLGSILDDLPADITDDSDTNDQYLLNSSRNTLSTEPLPWSTESMFEEGSLENTCLESELCKRNITDNITVDCSWNMDLGIINNDLAVPMSMISDISKNNTESVQKPAAISTTSNKIQPKMSPIILKPIKLIKNPTNISKDPNVKTHIKIGNNIFAIVQKGSNLLTQNKLLIKVQDPQEPTVILPSSKSTTSFVKPVKIEDHDYADAEFEDDDVETFGTMGVSKGLGPGLVLTDEEKKLLELENVSLPEDVVLTKDEEKILKKVRRKIKNKQSAMESRRRRKEYIVNLERRVKHCTDLNHNLKKKVDKLSDDNKSLLSQLKQLQSIVTASVQQNRSANTGTCLAVLVLSFALFFLPFNPINYGVDKTHNVPNMESPNPTAMFRSRTLLGLDEHPEYEYHDNESSNIAWTETDPVNVSKLYSEEMKNHIEQLIASDDGVNLLKLNTYLKQKHQTDYASNTDSVDFANQVNIVEIRDDATSSPGRVYTDEM